MNMARIVKDHDERRSEILDVAQELIYIKGYEQTSVRDIIDSVGIAKGTFYHYFSSKNQLLDELVERILNHTLQLAEPIVEDEHLDALQKLHRFFSTIENWKIDNRPFLKELMRAYFDDGNIVLRQRLKSASVAAMARPIAKITRQGIEEGVFDTRYPDDIGEIMLAIGQTLVENLAYLLLEDGNSEDMLDLVKRKVAVTNNSFERLLGAPTGSVNIYDFARLRPWFGADDVYHNRKEITEWENI
jgi:AcrR family transcriptional regulator